MYEVVTVGIRKTSFMLNVGRQYYFKLDRIRRYYFMINDGG